MVFGLRYVRGSTIIVAAAVISLLFLPLITSINIENTLLQFQPVFAQQQEGGTEGGEILGGIFGGGGNQSGSGGPLSEPFSELFGANQSDDGGGPLTPLPGGGQEGGQQEERAFLPYLDLTHDIFMQYPSNWTASTSGI